MPQMFDAIFGLIAGLVVMMFIFVVALVYDPIMVEATAPITAGAGGDASAISIMNLWPLAAVVGVFAFLIRSMMRPSEPQFIQRPQFGQQRFEQPPRFAEPIRPIEPIPFDNFRRRQ